MEKTRPQVPKATREEALTAFNHMCAACGEVRPQLHHIDGNPENNLAINLIPLCPNDHLRDAHDPTRPIEAGRLRLLRIFRDPTVLDPRFQPIFFRFESFREHAQKLKQNLSPIKTGNGITFSLRVPDREQSLEVERCAEEFWRFLQVFEKGDFYAREFERTLAPDVYAGILGKPQDRSSVVNELLRQDLEQMFAKMESLIVEMLRYQNWGKQIKTSRLSLTE